MWQQTENYPAGNPYPYTMVGNSPFSSGAGTTTISTPVVGVKFVVSGGSTLSDATVPASDCGQTLAPTQLALNSPIFQNAVPDPGGNLTQWSDALQRANFNQETQAGGISPNYHLLLSGSNAFNVTITVPAADAASSSGALCGTAAGVDQTWFLGEIPTVLSDLTSSDQISPTSLPMFVMYNTVLCGDITDCNAGGDLGFHDALETSAGLQMFGISDYDLSGTWAPTADASTLSHEVAEAVDDPLGTNPVPTWGYVGQDPESCQSNLEPGDPLSPGFPGSPGPSSFTYKLSGVSYTYHVQDLAFHSWFFRESTPTSKSVEGTGAYSLLGNFTTGSDATVCPAQPVSVRANPGSDQATVSWAAPTVGPVDAYDVVAYESGTPVLVTNYPSTATTATFSGLTNGDSYTFTVLALNANSTEGQPCPIDSYQYSVGSGGYDCSTESLQSNAVTPGTTPSLSIAKAHVGSFVSGSTGTYTLTVTNAGPATSGTVTVSDTLPTGESFSSGSGGGFSCSAAAQVVTCKSTTSIVAGTPVVITLTVNVTAGGGTVLSNQASVSPNGGSSNVDQVTVQAALLPYPAVSTAAISSTDVVVVGRSPMSALWYQQSSAGVFGGWQSVATSDVASQPVAVVSGSNLYVFFRATDNELHYFERTGSTWGTEQNLGGVIAGNPAVAVDGNGAIIVTALNSAGNVFANRLPSGGSWTGWTSLAGILSGHITLSTLNGNVYLLGVNAPGLGWTIEWSAGSTNAWGSWTPLGGVFEAGTTLSGAAYGSTLHVLGVNGQGILFEATGSGSTWSSWTPLNGILAATPSLAATTSSLFVFDTNPAGVLWYQQNTTSWLGWNSLAGVLETGPVSAAAGANAFVFGLNTDGNLWYREWNGTSFGAWTDLGGILATA